MYNEVEGWVSVQSNCLTQSERELENFHLYQCI